jgi:hypothetical protein
MKRKRFGITGISVVLLILALVLAGCGDSANGDPSSPGSGNNSGDNNGGNNGRLDEGDRTISLTKEVTNVSANTLAVTISHGEWKDDYFNSSFRISSMLYAICSITTTGDITNSSGVTYTAQIKEGDKKTLHIWPARDAGKTGTISFTLKDSGPRSDLMSATTAPAGGFAFVGSSSVANWTAQGNKGPYLVTFSSADL